MTPAQCDIWWAESEHERRPVLIVTRNEAIGVLNPRAAFSVHLAKEWTNSTGGCGCFVDGGVANGIAGRVPQSTSVFRTKYVGK